jgi:hypothetical protein
MANWHADVLGPLDVVFNVDVGSYIQSGVSDNEKQCLRDFFISLRTGDTSHTYRHIRLGHVILVLACNHIIEIVLRSSSGSGIVEGIRRAQTPPS